MHRLATLTAISLALASIAHASASANGFKLTNEPMKVPQEMADSPAFQAHLSSIRNKVTEILGPMHSSPFRRKFQATPQAGTPRNIPITSSNWSGYVDTMSAYHPNPTTQMIFNVPYPACTGQPQAVSIWPGYGGFTDNNVLQAGLEILDFDGSCNFQYVTFAEWFPDGPIGLFFVNPGDAISVLVNHDTGGFGNISVTDISTGDSVSGTITCDSCGGDPYDSSSVEWIVEAPTSDATGLPFALSPIGTESIPYVFQAADGQYAPRFPNDRPNGSSYAVSMHDSNGSIIAVPTLTGLTSFIVQTYP